MNKTTKVAGGFGAAAAAAMVFLIPALKQHEGLSLKDYQDVVGVYTVCYGHAYVKPGTVKTQKECDDLLKSDAYVYMKAVYDAMKYEPHPLVLAAHSDFAYNIGVNGYRRSNALKITNTGNALEGCKAMMGWHSLTKGDVTYDCRLPQNLKSIDGCRGLINRRNEEITMCTAGALTND